MRVGGLIAGVLLAAALLASPARAQDPPSAPVYTESTIEELRIPTEYGSIYGWVRRPVVPAGVRVPIILTYSPYQAIESPQPGMDDGTGDYYVPRGYARAWFHLVGTGRSGGCTDYGGIRERRTGFDIVEKLAAQPWSNGRVGMIGVSYDGTTQWATAVEAPPHLAAIVPQVGISRWWDYAYGQGVRFYSGNGTPLLFDVGFNQARVPGADPGDVTELPDEANPCDTAEHQIRGYGPDPVHDAFWDERDYRARADKIRAAVLIESSWADYNVHALNGYEMWHALPPSVPKWLREGQQGHGASPFKDAQKTRQAFYDKYLLGRDSGVESLPRVGSQANSGGVVSSTAFPPPGTQTTTLALKSLEGDGDTWSDTDPALSQDAVLDGSAPDGVSLLFRDKPVTATSVRLAGVAELVERGRRDKDSTYLTPVLFDEAPDGSRKVITRGLLNSRNRDSIRTSSPVEPGKPWHGVVRFQPTDWYLAKGHRLGLAVMSMNTTEAFYGDSTFATSTLDLARSSLRVPYAP